MKAGEAGKVLREHADAVGAVGQGRRQAKEQQQRKDQERAATGNDVEGAGTTPAAASTDQFEPEGHRWHRTPADVESTGYPKSMTTLKRAIGLPTATALVVGTIIGSSIFVQASEITQPGAAAAASCCWRGRRPAC